MHCHLSIPAWGTLDIHEIRHVVVAPSTPTTNSRSDFFPPNILATCLPTWDSLQIPEVKDL